MSGFLQGGEAAVLEPAVVNVTQEELFEVVYDAIVALTLALDEHIETLTILTRT